MKRLFPEMNDRPENWMPAALIGYWVFAFAIIPVWLPMITDGLWGDVEVNAWLNIIYHALNAVVMVCMLREYAKDSLLEVQLFPKKFVGAVAVAALLMLALAVGMWRYWGSWLWNVFPMLELSVAAAPGVTVYELPVYGTLCHTLIVPISVVGLLYVPCFAPMCCRKTWLGYLVLALALMIPSALDLLRDMSDFVILPYLLRLPIHLIACWSYQKADSVWAPIAALAIFNLGTSVLVLLFP